MQVRLTYVVHFPFVKNQSESGELQVNDELKVVDSLQFCLT